jgi:hypothetical protein
MMSLARVSSPEPRRYRGSCDVNASAPLTLANAVVTTNHLHVRMRRSYRSLGGAGPVSLTRQRTPRPEWRSTQGERFAMSEASYSAMTRLTVLPDGIKVLGSGLVCRTVPAGWSDTW